MPIQTLAELLKNLQQQVSTGTVTIDGSILSPRATQDIADDLLRTESNLILTTPSDTTKVFLSADQNSLFLTGASLPSDSTDSFLNLTSSPAALMFQQINVNGAEEFDLILRVTLDPSWVVSDSFPPLKFLDTDKIPFSGSPYFFFSTFPAAQPVPPIDQQSFASGDILENGLNLYGNVGISGVLTLVQDLVSGVSLPSYALYGLISQNEPGPTFDLKAYLFPGQSQPVNFDFIKASAPWIGVKALNVPLVEGSNGANADAGDDDTVSQAYLYLGTSIQLGSAPPLAIEAGLTLEASSQSLVTLMILPATPQGFGLGDIVQLTQIPVPQVAVKYLNDVQLSLFSAAFAIQPKPGLQSLSLQIHTSVLSFEWLTVQKMQFVWLRQFTAGQASDYLTFNAEFQFPELQDLVFDLSIAYTGTDWVVAGAQQGDKPFVLSAIFPSSSLPSPAGLLDVEFESFSFTADLTTKNYSLGAVVSADFQLFGVQILALKEMAIQVAVDASGEQKTYTAAINGILALGSIEFSVNANFSNKPGSECVLELHLVNETLGTMINHLVHLVDPDYDVTFPAPWNKLADINLDALVLKVNLTTKQVTLTYNTNIDLAFLEITGITLTYQKQETAASSVQISLDGKFLGQSIDENNPLGWDVINGQPPAVPGQGSSTFDLQYLGLGQHLTFSNLSSLTTVEAVMTTLRQTVYPIGNGTAPNWGYNGLQFAGGSNWLIGAQFTVMGTVSLSVIFNDPNLYGLLISLAGDRAKSLAGLSFEILYRKVSDTIGVYHIELKLPDAMRNLQFGEVSLTLPVVILDIYTNGNFRIDMGFPKGMDFSQSFALQVFPFVGYGGFYFALLDGQTSSRVPKISTGNFSPVIEFGIALSIGVGKTVDEGVLSGGITVTVVGILQGVVGWFNPNKSSVQKAEYYWVQGTIAIVGKLYATIDFVVIKASLNVTAYASVTLVVEAYQPIYISLVAGVSVEVSVKVVFFTIHLKFSAQVKASFTIGSASTPPWAPVNGSPALLRDASLHSPMPRFAGLKSHLRAQRSALQLLAGPTLNWEPAAVFSQIQSLPVSAFASFTQVTPATGSNAAQVDGVLLFCISNSVDPTAGPAKTTMACFGSDPSKAGFNLVSEAMLRWAVNAIGKGTTQVAADDLTLVNKYLSQPGSISSVMDYCSQLSPFLEKNFTLSVQAAVENGATPVSGTAFPVCPTMTMSTNDSHAVTVNFLLPANVDLSYQQKIDVYFQLLQQQQKEQQSAQGVAESTSQSMAEIIFEQYFGMVLKQAVQSAVSLMTQFPYSSATAFSLSDLQSALADPSLTAVQVVQPNFGTSGIFAPSSQLALTGVVYPVKQGDTFSSIAAAFGKATGNNVAPGGITAIPGNQTLSGLLQPGTAATFSGLIYTSQTGDTLNLIAVRILLRTSPPTILMQIANLSQMADAIIAANPAVASPPPPGVTLNMPASSAPLSTYTTAAGDTYSLIAGYAIALQQMVVDYSTFVSSLLAANPKLPQDPSAILPAGTQVTMPAVVRQLQPGDTIASLATLLLAPSTTPVESSLWPLAVLSPNVQLQLPPLTYNVQSADTFSSIAGAFNLTAADLAAGIDPESAIFNGKQILVSDLDTITVDVLVNGLLTSGQWNMNAGMVSRFMLSGAQLPNPGDPKFEAMTVADLEQPKNLGGVSTTPLYQLTSQQFPIDSPPPANYAVTLTNGNATSAPWLAVGTGNTLSLTLNADQTTFITQLGNTPLNPQVVSLSRLMLYQMAPSRYTLQQHVQWQAAAKPQALACLATAAGNPSLWLFPDSLVSDMATAPTSGMQYELAVGTHEDPNKPMSISDVSCFTWATLVNVAVTLPPDPGVGSANSYVITGADNVGQDLLQAVYQHLSHSSDAATLYLLYPPNPTSSFPAGLLSDVVDPQNTFILKTNLSTLTQSNLLATADVPTPTFNAPISDPKGFLQYLWEASIVGGGGFYLNYVNQSGNAPLPGDLFSQSKTATLYLLIVINNGSTESQPLYSFQNCALVGDNLDANSVNVFAQPYIAVVGQADTLTTLAHSYNEAWGANLLPADVAVLNQDNSVLLQVGQTLSVPGQSNPYPIEYGDSFLGIATKFQTTVSALAASGANATSNILETGAQVQFAPGILRPVSSVPPGQTGFELTRVNPDQENVPFASLPAANRVASLFQLAGYSLAGDSNFYQSAQGLPAGPLSASQDGGSGLGDAPESSSSDDWNYQQTLAIAPLAVAPAGSVCPALPPPASNPYGGIAARQTATLQFSFCDVFGNPQQVPDYESLAIPVGYYDPLIPLSQWPSVSAGYEVGGSSSSPQINATLSMQIDRYVPSLTLSSTSAQNAAQSDATACTKVYYQLAQPDVSFGMETTLDAASLNSNPPRYGLDLHAMRGFIESNYIFLQAVQTLQPFVHTTAGSEQLSAVANSFGLTAGQLLTANATQPYASLFGSTPLSVPAIHVVLQGDSLSSIGSGSITPAVLATNNPTAILAPGLDLSTPTRSYTVHDNFSLLQMSVEARCSVGGIADANHDKQNLFGPNLTFTVSGVQVPVLQTDSFDSLVTKFAALNIVVTPAEIALANQALPAVFLDQISISLADVITATNDSFGAIAASFQWQVADLGSANPTLPNIYPPGTALVLSVSSIAPSSADTLNTYATANQVTVAELAAQNDSAVFASGASLTIPGLVTNANPSQFSTYMAKGDTLSSIAGKYSLSPAALAEWNQDRPGLFAAASVVSSGQSVAVDSTSTFLSIVAAFSAKGVQLTVDQLAAAVATQSPLFADGGIWICPPMTGGDGAFNTLSGLASKYNLPVAAVAQANASAQGFLASGVNISYGGRNLQTQPDDTFNSLVNRLAQLQVTVDAPALAAALEGVHGLINPTAMVVPVPQTVNLPVTITPKFTSQIFPVTVNVVERRDPTWVHPDFTSVAGVSVASTPLAPEPFVPGGAALSLAAFATSFETALPGLHVATGNSVSEEDPATARAISAVNFGHPAGPSIAYQFDWSNGTAFAIPPLSTSVMSANVEFGTYVSGQSFPAGSQQKTLQSVDLDVWANAFLEAIDLFLTPSYAIPAFALSPASFNSIVNSKQQLASLIASRVLPVYASQSTAGLGDAVEAMEQSLLVKLANAYSVESLVQVPVAVTSASTSPVLLSGKPIINGVTGPQVQDLSLTTAKVGLSNASETATFLLSVKSPALTAHADFLLDYQVNQLEIVNSSAPAVDGYQASDWLSFVNPLSGLNPKQTAFEVPMPLRAYPSPVSLVDQSGIQSVAQPRQPQDLVGWDYTMTYDHLYAAQDSTAIEIVFNQTSPSSTREPQTTANQLTPLLTQLAQFITAYPLLKDDLALLPKLPQGQANKIATLAVQAFESMVSSIIANWPAPTDTRAVRFAQQDVVPFPPIPMNYSLSLIDDSSGVLTQLVLSSSASNPVWPAISVVVQNQAIGLGNPEVQGSQATYSYPSQPPVSMANSLRHVFTFPGQSILTAQNGWAGVQITRNAQLSAQASKQTNDSFIYKTPVTGFSSMAVPLIQATHIMPITGQHLSDALADFFAALFGSTSTTAYPIRIACSYAYQLAASTDPGVDPLNSLMPVLLVPSFNYTPNASSTFAAELAQAVLNSSPAPTQGSAYWFDVSIFSSVDALNMIPLSEASAVRFQPVS